MANRAALLGLLAAFAVSCENGAAPPHAATTDATVTLAGRTFTATLVLTEKERRHGPENFDPLSEGHAYLMAWPSERAVKFESKHAQASFCVVCMDRGGKVTEVRLFAQGDEEGVMPKKDVATALFVRPNLFAQGAFKEGAQAEFSDALKGASPEELPAVKIGDHTAYVELSMTAADREQGLMFRDRLSPDYGMLFVYPDSGSRSFWMGNTLIPLDIAFFTADGTLLNVNETKTYPDPLRPPSPYPTSDSDGAAQYVLEMTLGWFRKRGLVDEDGEIKPGTKAVFPPQAVKRSYD